MLRFIIAVVCLANLALAAPQIHSVPVLGGRIVGGEPTVIEKYPYQASLQEDLSHMCGAVVISEEYVLTAAHCTDGILTSKLSIRVGSSFRNSGGIVIQVADVYQSPNYNYLRTLFDYDISVLRLASPISFGSAVAPIVLPEINQTVGAGSIGQVSGWGALAEGGSLATQLQVVELPVVSLEECKGLYGASLITDRMVCAGYPEGGKDSCQQDSGGPLVINGTLIGLVSFGSGCARANSPGVYASVPALREYITAVTGL